jgi:hypothetical protein
MYMYIHLHKIHVGTRQASNPWTVLLAYLHTTRQPYQFLHNNLRRAIVPLLGSECVSLRWTLPPGNVTTRKELGLQ